MSKILTFRDGQTFNATNSSTITSLHTVCANFAELDAEWAKFTIENMAICEMDGVTYTDIIPVSVSATKDGNNIVGTFTCREMNQSEIIQRQGEQITELQEALAEIIG